MMHPTARCETRLRHALIVGASRGLGRGLTGELLRQGWCVTATIRDFSDRPLRQSLGSPSNDVLKIERVDIARPEEIAALKDRLTGCRFDLLFVVSGVTNDSEQTIGEVTTEEFIRVLVVNALGPMRVIEQLVDFVTPEGQVAVMSSELGSVAENYDGGWEVYRASKASLNTLMRSLVARRSSDRRTFYVIAPGWVRTDMGGPLAPLDVETSVRGVLEAMRARTGTHGAVFVDFRNEILPW